MKNIRGDSRDYSSTKVTIKTLDKNKVAHTYRSGTKRRFISIIERSAWEKIDIKVWYGKRKNTYGEIVYFTNEGIYTNTKDAKQAFLAFIEL